jgi:hypothetical protein
MSDYNQPLDSGIGSSSALEITPRNYADLQSAGKWAKLLAIGHFIMSGFSILVAILFFSMGASLAREFGAGAFGGGSFMAFFYLLNAAILIMPGLFLWRFARRTTQALDTNDQMALQDSLTNLNSLFKFYGIIMLLFLVLIGIGIVFSLLGGLFAVFAS